ncbi:lipin Ned1, partial [Tilletia horrida]
MQYVGRLMSTVYNSITPNINPATLSGAIDIIVVERQVKKPRNGSGDADNNDSASNLDDGELTTELASTPFHVRFGKMSVLRPAERKVTLHLNGSPEPLPFHMKVGETGEAFFVLEVDDDGSDDIPDALVTSPLLSAASSPSASPGFGGSADDSQAFDVEPLDLGASAVTPAEIGTARAATQAAVERREDARASAALGRLSLDEIEIDSDVRSAAASSQRTAVEPAVPVTSKELDVMLDMDGYKVTGEAGQDHRHHHFSRMLHRAAQKADRVEAESELRRETELFFGRDSERELSSPLQAALDLANGPKNLIKPFELPSARSRRASFDMGRESGDNEGESTSADDILRELRSKNSLKGGSGTPRSDSVAFDTSDAQQTQAGDDEADISHRLLARAKSDPAIDISASSSQEVVEKIMEDVVHGPAGSLQNRQNLIASKASKRFIKTLRLSSDQLKSLNLKKGMNTISFSVTSSYSGVATCTARIFLWDSSFQVVVSDIDGTITKSDALGHVFTMIGRDWTHLGVAKLYTDVARNGYHVMYLTSRAIGQADITRDYLKGINQNGYRLPDGPVIMSPDRLIASLHREVILRKPEVFKMACLRDIARLFGCDFRNNPHQPHAAGTLAPPTSAQAVGAELQSQNLEAIAAAGAHNAHHSSTPTPFFAGFGNRITDALSYRSVNVPSSRIFTIDWNGEVKMELLELAGYNTSYVKMNELVDQFFPPIRAAEVSNPRQREFNDVNYWRQPIEEIELPMEDLSPPVSPA